MEIAEVSGIRGQEIQIHPIFERKENGRLEKTGEILHTGKLKEYGQYEKYEELMGKVFHGTEGVET